MSFPVAESENRGFWDMAADMANVWKNILKDVLDWIWERIKDGWGYVRDFFEGLWSDYISPWLESAWNWTQHQFFTQLDNVIESTGAAGWLEENQGIVTEFVGYAQTANGFLPLSEMVGGLGIIFAFSVVCMGLKIVVKAVRG